MPRAPRSVWLTISKLLVTSGSPPQPASTASTSHVPRMVGVAYQECVLRSCRPRFEVGNRLRHLTFDTAIRLRAFERGDRARIRDPAELQDRGEPVLACRRLREIERPALDAIDAVRKLLALRDRQRAAANVGDL